MPTLKKVMMPDRYPDLLVKSSRLEKGVGRDMLVLTLISGIPQCYQIGGPTLEFQIPIGGLITVEDMAKVLESAIQGLREPAPDWFKEKLRA